MKYFIQDDQTKKLIEITEPEAIKARKKLHAENAWPKKTITEEYDHFDYQFKEREVSNPNYEAEKEQYFKNILYEIPEFHEMENTLLDAIKKIQTDRHGDLLYLQSKIENADNAKQIYDALITSYVNILKSKGGSNSRLAKGIQSILSNVFKVDFTLQLQDNKPVRDSDKIFYGDEIENTVRHVTNQLLIQQPSNIQNRSSYPQQSASQDYAYIELIREIIFDPDFKHSKASGVAELKALFKNKQLSIFDKGEPRYSVNLKNKIDDIARIAVNRNSKRPEELQKFYESLVRHDIYGLQTLKNKLEASSKYPKTRPDPRGPGL